jgi:leucyl/phenylalanyl-tRNA--protein transferase
LRHAVFEPPIPWQFDKSALLATLGVNAES